MPRPASRISKPWSAPSRCRKSSSCRPTFIRKSVELAVEQAKELQTVTTKAAEDVSKPLKAVFEKAVKELKVA